MFFVASKVLWFLATPSNLLLVVGLAGCGVAVLTRRRALGLGLGLASLLALGAAGLSPVPAWLGAPLEERFPAFADDGGPVAGIVVLGGAVEPEASLAHGQLVLNDAGERMIALGDLARRYPEARIVFSGGSGRLRGGASEAEIVRRHAAGLGVEPGRLLYEERSRNTRENATYSAALAAPAAGERWLLVTSAWHMPRAVGCFRRAGFPVTPYPVDYRTAGGDVPPAMAGRGLFQTDVAVREWAGLLAYHLAGYTDALFPAPNDPPATGQAAGAR
ncbi:hypothetical protein OPKNFCMD_2577 [Methylobacterium crusticola]|uniref:DUF218 domain-containing protein n=1 Tax=Methylobacterium crusticola TaxID=1697972 RepID=A0ABQ4QWS6_9HYPH|nr:YdcF family protein [Methylobacterium crusticola]GJD49842.1 hypothetical protein OPKNFCMD_2577 [Methylobacterium crusticola]